MRGQKTPVSNDVSDAELIAGCLTDKDSAAWEIFVRKYSKLIWSCIHRTFRGYSFWYAAEDLEDVYSAVFLSLVDNDFKKLRQFQNRNSCRLSTWLAVVAVRHGIDYMRRQQRNRMKSLDEDPVFLESLADNRANTEIRLIEQQQHDSLEKTIAALPLQDKTLFDLLFTQNLPPESAARQLGISAASFYTRKHRLIEKIKNIMDGKKSANAASLS